MADTRQAKANKGNRIALGVLISAISLFCFLSAVGALGGVGRMVYGFLVGFFGLAVYAYTVMGVIGGIAVIFNIRVKMRPSRALFFFGLFFIGVLALHVYTSSAHIVGAGYGDYLMNCYNNTNTAGGMLFGVVAFPIMKAITAVGALVIVCAAFFVLALFGILPLLKRNVTYTVASKRERDKNSSVARERKPLFAKKQKETRGETIGAQSAPVITDLSQSSQSGSNLFVVDVKGDPMRLDKKAKGAAGYRPLDSYDPLYPNAKGGYEDEVKLAPNPYDKYSARGVAKDILFGQGPIEENLSKFNTLNNPKEALSSVGPSYNAIKRSELRSRLIEDQSQNAIREDFMARYRAQSSSDGSSAETIKLSALSDANGSVTKPNPLLGENAAAEKKEEPIDFKTDFYQLKKEQIQRFNEMYVNVKPEFESTAHTTPQSDNVIEAETVKKEVVKPTKVMQHPDAGESINSTIKKAENAVNVGLQGAVNRAVSGEEPPKPVQKTEYVSQGYEKEAPQADIIPSHTVASTAKQTKSISELDNSGYTPKQGEIKLPRAFEGTAVRAQDVAKDDDPEPNFFGGVGAQKPAPKPYEMKKASLERSRDKYSDGDATQGGDVPSAPAPVQQKVTGDSMSRAAIQSTTAIAKQSARDIESAEVKARIQNIKQAIKETPAIGEYEREALMRQEKVQAAQSRGVKAEPAKKADKGNKERVSQMNIEQAIAQATPKRPYVAPPASLLEPPAPQVEQNEDYDKKKEAIVSTLDFFGIKGEVVGIMVGPTFSMYKLKVEMPRGRTINYIFTLENDIAMKMEVSSVRITPITRENAVAIEVPNKVRRNVNLSEIINSKEFNQAKAPATFALGQNLFGDNRVVDVKKLPHALIAGATGAGKSCCINSVIISLLYKASPDDVRFILIDPKRVELSIYAGIPHLLMDEIICDTDKAIRALNWAIEEMERRIKYFAEVGFREIDEYNDNCAKLGYEKMPRIIIIVDEFADLMSTGKKAVEDTINRIARLARAVGIHLLLATQRPSVDVISGTIKNNLPSRIAFKVTSSFDSKTILDSVGADKLLGYGDLLYMTPSSAELERMQGAFISNEEVKRVVDFIKANNDSYFDNKIKDAIFKDKEEERTSSGGAKDKAEAGLPPELFKALELGIQLREDDNAPISISYMQRKLGLGWPKAAKIYDLMDDLGYLTPDEHDAKKKKVNISYEELDELMQSQQEGEVED